MDVVNTYYPLNMFRLCVDDDKNKKNIGGRAISPLTEEIILFSDLTELLLEMDKLFDKVGYPQAFQIKRSFLERSKTQNSYRGIPEAKQGQHKILEARGKIGTYDVLVTSRRNTTWQGEIYDIDKNQVGSFVGDVDLLGILTEIMK